MRYYKIAVTYEVFNNSFINENKLFTYSEVMEAMKEIQEKGLSFKTFRIIYVGSLEVGSEEGA